MSIQLGNKLIERNGAKVYVVAEIGQNHQGNMRTARELILAAKLCGCDCVKFQKSHLPAKFTKSALERPYENGDSFGQTYGQHKTYLEFNLDQFQQLQKYCQEIGIDFSSSAMDEVSLDQLDQLAMPFIKIGSGDANNFPLLEKAAHLTSPLIISTGMQTLATLDRIVAIMTAANKKNYAMLHCVSSYPTNPEDVTLSMIPLLRNRYNEIVIGYSGHELGTILTPAAVLLGARIVERHFTFDHTFKGSDHKCSLDPSEMSEMVERLRALPLAKNPNHIFDQNDIEEILLGAKKRDYNDVEVLNLRYAMAARDITDKIVLPCELNCKKKLGKSIVAAHNLRAGHCLIANDIVIKVSEPCGLSADQLPTLIGMKLIKEIFQDEPIQGIDLLDY